MIENVSIDQDERWTPVPDDPISVRHGMPRNSRRQDGVDKEYEDTVNEMRREDTHLGCREAGTLGVTYSTMKDDPDNPDDPGSTTNVDPSRKYRQTITVGQQSKPDGKVDA